MIYYIIAGEASGDLHSSNLMAALKNLDKQASFRFWGGDLMKAQGGVLVKHYRELAFMGFSEVLLNIKTILRNMAFCKKDILEFRPDVLILVDYPGFNLRIAEFAKQNGLKVVYYISPQLWAWKQSRIHTIKRSVDKMLVILPFEKDFYSRFNYEVEFVGHPLLDAITKDFEAPSIPESQKPLIALLPGSRKQEISVVLPLMLSVIPFFSEFRFVVAAAPSIPKEYYKSLIGDSKTELVFNQTYGLLRMASAALVTSGTATLETALFGVPEVVCYRGGMISYRIAKKLIKVKFISLVNLIMDREIVRELIQDELTVENMKVELQQLLGVEKRKQMQSGFDELRQKLGGSGASRKAAESIYRFLQR